MLFGDAIAVCCEIRTGRVEEDAEVFIFLRVAIAELV